MGLGLERVDRRVRMDDVGGAGCGGSWSDMVEMLEVRRLRWGGEVLIIKSPIYEIREPCTHPSGGRLDSEIFISI